LIAASNITEKEARVDRYGSFRYSYQADDDGIDTVKAHKAPEFQRLGTITCYGETDGLEIGSINKAVQQLGRIACTEGTLPSEKWEIAAQASIFKA